MKVEKYKRESQEDRSQSSKRRGINESRPGLLITC
jgi:hypothetical protein